jgi:hypothetical protein
MTPTVQLAIELGLATTLIHVLVRKLKAGRFNKWITPTWRPIVALLLGGVAAAVEAFGLGRTQEEAVLIGLAAAGSAALGHDFVVEGLRKGREFGRKA